ncbi:GntR family transcriptional regulator [Paractinoplanes atraurantiacus]|uniref:DNA-binding transcriptional regulator, GntR family n=1 Tax=Paractinoplanes atraurantiacus TaxID=1036182 RepID=A0A285FJP0_9ACTN|nr:GntR family transcriptional regulator [Actinoplanes atraurantiacus]SNY11480.1 DNA-binding transcriptional regulator, GntR family [Actinoplanes atraurantiacus]
MTPSERMYVALRAAILHGDFAPRQSLKPQELATKHVVSLAVARETLLRLVGEGLAERLPNRGFAVPATGAERWQQIAEARATVEPAMLRMAIERGDLEWEARVRAAHHRLARATPYEQDPDSWSEAHRLFHRALLEACGNDVLLGTFDRLWIDSELARRWSAVKEPARDAAAEHLALEEAVLAREAGRAADLLRRHVTRTVRTLRTS